MIHPDQIMLPTPADQISIVDRSKGKVDPWEQQRLLMVASGQQIPTSPTLTKGSILYGALLLEETGETMAALAGALSLVEGEGPGSTPLRGIQHRLLDLAQVLQQDAGVIRCALAGATTKLDIPLPPSIATELFDGTTDVAVVNCGLALACGLPGAAGYTEVASSNLSKANPETGVIDKHPDGKWIKGAGYKEPDLERVLREHHG